MYIYLQSSKTTIPCYLIFFHTYLPLLFIGCLAIEYPILLLTYLPLLVYPLLFIFSTCKSSTEVVTIEPSTVPVDGSKSTLTSVGPVETSRKATDATVEESTIIKTTALTCLAKVFNSTGGVIERKVGWYMIYADIGTILKAVDVVELSPLVEFMVTIHALLIGTSEVESEALSIAPHLRMNITNTTIAWDTTVTIVGSTATISPAVTTLLIGQVGPRIITATNTLLHVVVKVTAAVILASTLRSIVGEASSTTDVEAAIENKEWIVPVVVTAPFDLQELSRLELFKLSGVFFKVKWIRSILTCWA